MLAVIVYSIFGLLTATSLVIFVLALWDWHKLSPEDKLDREIEWEMYEEWKSKR